MPIQLPLNRINGTEDKLKQLEKDVHLSADFLSERMNEYIKNYLRANPGSHFHSAEFDYNYERDNWNLRLNFITDAITT